MRTFKELKSQVKTVAKSKARDPVMISRGYISVVPGKAFRVVHGK